MAIERSTIVKGPAILQYNTVNIYTEGDIDLTLEVETDEKNTNIYGKVDERILNRTWKVSFTPSGLLPGATATDMIATLWPYAATVPGASIFADLSVPANDRPLVIYTTAGKTITLPAAAVTKCPSLHLATKGQLLGAMEFTGINKNNTAWSDAASLATVAALAWTDPATYTVASELNAVYSGAWAAAAAAWNTAFTTEDGFDIDFDVSTKAIDTDAHGIVDYAFEKMDVRVKCKPIGATAAAIAEAEILGAGVWQNTGAARGKSLSAQYASAHNLVISGGAVPNAVTFTLVGAAAKSAGMRFGVSTLRNGEVGWIATRTITGGVVSPLYTLTITVA